jgi:hypothetical protein
MASSPRGGMHVGLVVPGTPEPNHPSQISRHEVNLQEGTAMSSEVAAASQVTDDVRPECRSR